MLFRSHAIKLSSVLCDDLDGWDGMGVGREVREGGDISIHVGDSFHCTTETNTVL